jgi:hypothetical protein
MSSEEETVVSVTTGRLSFDLSKSTHLNNGRHHSVTREGRESAGSGSTVIDALTNHALFEVVDPTVGSGPVNVLPVFMTSRFPRLEPCVVVSLVVASVVLAAVSLALQVWKRQSLAASQCSGINKEYMTALTCILFFYVTLQAATLASDA